MESIVHMLAVTSNEEYQRYLSIKLSVMNEFTTALLKGCLSCVLLGLQK